MTREGLRDGSLRDIARVAGGSPILSDEEIHASLQATLAQRPEKSDVWVFGYGSLIWNPTIAYAEKRAAQLSGWHRRFCLSTGGRGSPETPGLMLALDEGGSCQGVAFRLEESKAEGELSILWIREMLIGSYQARWLTAQTAEGDIPVLTFVANREHARFLGDLSEVETVERIAFARGPLGSCLDYLISTRASLEAIGLRDAGLDNLFLKVDARLRASGVE